MRPVHLPLAGSSVLVTGASSGIGRASAVALARRGALVAAAGRDQGALDALAREEPGVVPLAGDLAPVAAAEELVAAAEGAVGPLDAVVAAAGVGLAEALPGPAGARRAARAAEVVDVDLRAPLLLAAAALPGMVARGRGSFVVVSSIAGAVGVPGEAVYSAAKAGLSAFAATAREELRGTGVLVCDVVPGVVDTPFFVRRGAPYERRSPRPVSAERVAAVVVRAVEHGPARQVVPAWLAVPARLQGAAPGLFRALARRLDPSA